MTRLKALFLSLLPKDSERVEIVGEQNNPITLNAHASYGLTAAFILHAQAFRLSVLFVNLEREQIRCKVMARPEDFEQAHSAFLTSLYGLQWSP